MKLYHGSNQIILQPRLLKPTHPMDFGQGFYTTTNYAQAAAFAKKIVKWRGGTETVSIYELGKVPLNFKIIHFKYPNKKWLDFVVNNRLGKDVSEKVDIITGPVANDDVYGVVESYEMGDYTEQEALKRLKVKKLFNQYVFKTQEAVNLLKFLGGENAGI
ncbi:MAG: DUF3990 domain-containing protein [Endomicrobium sp.]|jgi:hypothetical protein|nr:DUF3990 domain-containing protein [Endomicrobium sp.]